MKIVQVAICLLIRDGKVLLAQKCGGKGHGHWSGYGGKFELSESPKQAVIREVWEESGLVVRKQDLKKCAVIKILKAHKHKEFELHVYTTSRWSGILRETKEMRRPKWFIQNQLPLRRMWPTDKIWIPWVLAGKQFRASFNSGAVAQVTEFKEGVAWN